MNYKNLKIHTAKDTITITVNRPKKLNALNQDTIQELHEAFKAADIDDNIKIITITGSGEKAFIAGADIKEFANYGVEEGTQLAANGQKKLFDFIENLNKPVIAAINGFALGGGLELAMACHIRVASNNAKMGLPEVSLGLIPGYGGTQRLTQLVGKGRAMEMILTAGMIDTSKALQYGLINHVVTPNKLLDFCNTLANKIIQNAPTAISAAIRAVNANFKTGINGYQTEISEFGHCFGTSDFIEGTTAFLNKRKANF